MVSQRARLRAKSASTKSCTTVSLKSSSQLCFLNTRTFLDADTHAACLAQGQAQDRLIHDGRIAIEIRLDLRS